LAATALETPLLIAACFSPATQEEKFAAAGDAAAPAPRAASATMTMSLRITGFSQCRHRNMNGQNFLALL
jgi:hypothetical protein